MNKIYLLLIFTLSLFANDGVHKFAPNKDCKSCHAQIYSEFISSMHANTTPDKDVIHKAIWNKHPANQKMHRYICGKCHTPAANNLDMMLTKGKRAMPDIHNKTHQEAISCAYCHRIKDIKKGKNHNINIISTKEKSYYGTMKEHINSPYHEIKSDKTNFIQAGNTCLGCHSHETNKYSLSVCSTNMPKSGSKDSCITCHMPQVKGTVSSLKHRETHTFHGFAGVHFHSDMLKKYIIISIIKDKSSFTIKIKNKSSHSLLIHPLRVGLLKISVKRGKKTIKIKKEVFVRIIGKDKKPAMPWIANKVLKDTMIKANETRSVKRVFTIKKGDKVDVVLGWFLVNPKAVKKLGLDKEKDATKFHIFQKRSFKF